MAHHGEIGSIGSIQPGRVVAQLPLEGGEGVLVLIPQREVIASAVFRHHEDEETEHDDRGD